MGKNESKKEGVLIGRECSRLERMEELKTLILLSQTNELTISELQKRKKLRESLWRA